MSLYKITEFRSNMRKAFNEAQSGEKVVIDKYGDKFQLVSFNEKYAIVPQYPRTKQEKRS